MYEQVPADYVSPYIIDAGHQSQGDQIIMPKRIYIGNLSFSADESEIRSLFEPFGTVHEVNLITDRDSGRFRGFGFVEMDEDTADAAITELDGKEIGGRNVRVSEAREKTGGRRLP
jgi:RNA recognition motif-containing protein